MFRLATTADIDQIEQLFVSAKRRMAADGLEQWSDEGGYPNRQIAIEDVENQISYVLEIDNQIAGVITINDDFYDAYPITPDPLTARALHRVAVNDNFLGKGLGCALYQHSEAVIKKMGYNTVIVDTYSKNLKMNNLIKKCDYTPVGEFSLFEDLPNWIMYIKQI